MVLPVAKNLDKTFEMLKGRGSRPDIPLLSLPHLNSKIWGLHKKKLTVVAARTSNGKSALAIQIAMDTAAQGIPTLFFSLEMYEEDVIERAFCQSMKIDNMELLTGNFHKYQAEWEAFKEKLKKMPLVVTDGIGRNWQEVYDYLEQLPKKPKVIIIDHVQEAKDASQPNQRAVIEEYLRKLREMAIRHDFAAIVLSQVNRSAQEADHKEPKLHHLKGTGYLEEGADVIMLLHWPYYYSKKRGENDRFIINVAKNRNGRTGYVEVSYTPQHYLFADYVPKPKDETKAPVKDYTEPADTNQEQITWDEENPPAT